MTVLFAFTDFASNLFRGIFSLSACMSRNWSMSNVLPPVSMVNAVTVVSSESAIIKAISNAYALFGPPATGTSMVSKVLFPPQFFITTTSHGVCSMMGSTVAPMLKMPFEGFPCHPSTSI